ncbi:MAG: hypothetical protein ACI306_04845 [Muribaculaceae bacterium]
MKKVLFKTMLLVAALAMTTACGGSSKNDTQKGAEAEDAPVVIKPASTTIGGKLGKAFDVEDVEYTITRGIVNKMKVTISRNASEALVNLDDVVASGSAEGSTKSLIGEFTIDFLDANGAVLGSGTDSGGFDAAMSLLEGDKCSLDFYVDEEVLATVKTFRLGTTLKENPDALKNAIPDGLGISDEDLETIERTTAVATSMMGAAASAIGMAGDAAEVINDMKNR